MTSNLPGYDEATALGYSLVSYSGNGKQANYYKDNKTLIINNKGNASLWDSIMMIELEIKSFSFPSNNFHLFEKSLDTILAAYQEYINRISG
jgi:hypothetical protein